MFDSNEILQEQARLREMVEDSRERLVAEGRQAVETQGYVKAVVLAWTGFGQRPSFFFPEWEDVEERDETFSHLKKVLKEKLEARATLTMTNGTWLVDEEEDPAILVIARTPSWSELTVLPFEHDEGETVWKDPEVIEDFRGGFVRVPEEA